jgi:hypothetical protein
VPIKIGGGGIAITVVTDWEHMRQGFPSLPEKEITMRASHEAYDLMTVPLVACALLNVKNVVMRLQSVNERLQKKRVKQGKLPLVKMYTLEIEAPGKRFVGESSPMPKNLPPSSSRPLHLVRGHLADYRDGKGLFGKHRGVYWIPSHMRGEIDNGIIKKRYRVTTDNS